MEPSSGREAPPRYFPSGTSRTRAGAQGFPLPHRPCRPRSPVIGKVIHLHHRRKRATSPPRAQLSSARAACYKPGRSEQAAMRRATVERRTKETEVTASVALDGSGRCAVASARAARGARGRRRGRRCRRPRPHPTRAGAPARGRRRPPRSRRRPARRPAPPRHPRAERRRAARAPARREACRAAGGAQWRRST